MQVYSTKSSIMLSQLCLNFESGGSIRWCFHRFRAMTASTSSVSSADGSDAETTLPRRRVGEREDIVGSAHRVYLSSYEQRSVSRDPETA